MIYRFNKYYDVIDEKWIYVYYDENNEPVLKDEN
tara:strand:+ start:4919 stop:5020 length:102 start_codon:yes stop_codon:yes gene_type:complete